MVSVLTGVVTRRSIKRRELCFVKVLVAFIFLSAAEAQTVTHTDTSKPDVLILIDDERLVGHLERSTADAVTFKSDLAGEVTVDWTKIKTLETNSSFAVIGKGIKLGWKEDQSKFPQGTLSVTDGTIRVHRGSEASGEALPIGTVADVINQTAFEKAIARKPSWYQDWKGSATVGVAFVQATQASQTYTSGISLNRAIPTESWMQSYSRTTLNFNSAYGQLSQPGTETVKTSIFHGNGEYDRYFSPQVYVFENAAFDHDYSQGLNLQQSYGAGIGWTVIKAANEQFDLRSELAYVNQQFLNSTNDQKLLGGLFSEAYNHKFRRNIVLSEQISINPSFTNTRTYSANGSFNLAIPVIKRISISLNTSDAFLNDPSPGYRKNSLQLSTGLTYVVP